MLVIHGSWLRTAEHGIYMMANHGTTHHMMVKSLYMMASQPKSWYINHGELWQATVGHGKCWFMCGP